MQSYPKRSQVILLRWLLRLKVLEHVQIKISATGTIAVKSPSLLTLYAFFKNDKPCYKDPKQGEWFETEDKGKLLSKLEKLLSILPSHCKARLDFGSRLHQREFEDFLRTFKALSKSIDYYEDP